MAQSNVPVMESARAAYRFWREAWRPVLPALLLLGALSALQYYWSSTGQVGWSMLAVLPTIAVQVVAVAALFRIALADEHAGDPQFRPGPGGLQWRGMETRMLGAYLLLLLLGLLGVLLFAFVFIIVVVVVGAGAGGLQDADSPQEIVEALGPGAIATLGVLLLLFAAAAVFVSVRLTLALPATAAEGRVRVFETWPLTKGQFWRILGATIVVSAPSILFGLVNSAVTGSMAEEGAREGVEVLDPPVAAVMAVLSGLVTGVLQAPLSAGLAAYLYRGLRDAGVEAPPAAPVTAPV